MSDLAYGCARLASLEKKIIGKDKQARLMDAKDLQETYRLLEDYGVNLVHNEDGKVVREDTLLTILNQACQDVNESIEGCKSANLWRYPYDCNNLKAILKANFRGIEPDSMLFDFGTVALDETKKAFEKSDFSAFPKNIALAAQKAKENIIKNQNPQMIDLLLDKACYQDMLENAMESGNQTIIDLVLQKIDVTNILIAIRVIRMNLTEVGAVLLEESLLDGGTIEKKTFLSLYASGANNFAGEVNKWQILPVKSADAVMTESLASLEKLADNTFMKSLKKIRLIPYGEECVSAFMLAHEMEVKNLRIILAGKETGMAFENIKERMRESYV